MLNHLVRFLGYFKARVELGEMVRQAEEQGVFSLPVRQALAVMLDAGNALYRDQQGDLMELSMERARAQAGLDAMFGAGVATEARTLEDMERDEILRALKACGGVVGGPKGAAARLGLNRTTLNSRMRKLGIARSHLG